MQPILVSFEAPFRCNLQKNTGPVGCKHLTGPVVHWGSNFIFAMRSPFKMVLNFENEIHRKKIQQLKKCNLVL